MPKTRKEKDVLGTIEVPAAAYFGSFTARAQQNFRISGLTAPPEFRSALAIIKKAAALTNRELKEIEPAHAAAIIKAADEFLAGKYNDQFTLDVFQAGAGTPFNMNINEILANRANELLGGKKGDYSPITPNNHVNWGQSSNDVIPTAMRIAALIKLKTLHSEVEKLGNTFMKKAAEFKHILKIGRTHLQDAVPITLEQEFNAYGSAILRAARELKNAYAGLLEVQIGGTALGTGITSHPHFKPLMVKNLSALTGFKLKSTTHPMELNANMNAFAMASNGLRLLANSLIKICNDLTILNSGPKGGLNEISLPEVEPGSSIMPGKINPSIVECVSMVTFQVMGNDLAINSAVQHANLELNVMTPVIMFNLTWSMSLLENACSTFREKCVKKIKANPEDCERLLHQSLCLATGLSPYLGYSATALLVKEALRKKKTLYETVAEKNFMTETELKKILSAKELTSPHLNDKALIKRIKNNQNYRRYLKNT